MAVTSRPQPRRAAGPKAAPPGTESAVGPAHARAQGDRRGLRILALALTGVLAFVGVGAATAYYSIQGNINVADAGDLLGDRPEQAAPDPDDPHAGRPMNILVIGSDSRDGDNTDFTVQGVEGMRSDVTILMHVSADRSRVEMISVPRDSMVQIPSCQVSGGGATAPTFNQFNAAFATGFDAGGDVESAVACTITTLESLTDVYIDDFVVVDFNGFQSMVDALGGIPMCIPNAIDAPKARLKLEAGEQVLDGAEALGYARARYGEGLGGDASDLKRIGRQQELLAATMRSVLDKNLLTDAGSLFQFLEAGTSSLTMSPDLAPIPNLGGLAFSLRGISSGNITFMTVPLMDYPQDPNRVVWTAEADVLWQRVRDDVPITGEPPEPAVEPTTPPSQQDGTEPEDTADGGTADATESPAADAEPSPAETKQPGRDAFTPDDVTNECG